MVVQIYSPVERGLHTTQPRTTFRRDCSILRCLRIMGLRRGMEPTLAAITMCWHTAGLSHCDQGANSDHYSHGHLGIPMEGKTIKVLSDNSAAVAAINNQSSRVQEMAHMLRCLAFICGRFQIHISASHIPGTQNCIADALSRNNLTSFYTLLPQASRIPSLIPGSLLQLLLLERPDWTLQSWTSLWSDTFPPD